MTEIIRNGSVFREGHVAASVPAVIFRNSLPSRTTKGHSSD